MNRLVLPVPPSVNHAYKNLSVRRRVKTLEASRYITEAGWIAREWIQKTGWKQPDPKKKVAMRVWIWWANNRRRDADNIFKILNDSLTAIVFWDDRMVLPQVMDFSIDKSDPRVEIEFEVIE